MKEALGVTGAAIGFIGSGFNPLGAQIGFTVGYGIGSYVDPDVIPAPSLGEAPVQTGSDGIPRPIVWGVCYLHGNILQTGPIDEVVTSERSGKGGPEVETRRRYRTFAIGLCQGPIEGVSRIWENGRLVYDTVNGRVNAEDQADYAEKITIYLGTDDQLPDPDLEIITGVGDTLAYRETSYIIWPNYDITDTLSSIAQYAVEVNGSADLSVTSKPYPIDVLDGIQVGFAQVDPHDETNNQEGFDVSFTPQDGTLKEPLVSYDYDTEGFDVTFAPQNGTLAVKLQSTDYDTEGFDVTFAPQNGTLSVQLVTHSYEDEGFDVSFTPKDGTLT